MTDDSTAIAETPTISFEVFGIPQTKGSAKAFPFRRKDGRLGVAVGNDNKKTQLWGAMIHQTAQQHKPETPWDGPISLLLVFNLKMPQDVQKRHAKGRLEWHTKKPDLDKLLRAVKDALKGVIYLDDSQVVESRCRKVYAQAPGVVIHISRVGIGFLDISTQEEVHL